VKGPARLPIAVGIAAGLICWLTFHLAPGTGSDLNQNLVGARALLAGENPYRVAGREEGFFYPLLYPLPAILVVAPLAPLPMDIARALFAALSAAVFTVAAMRYGRGLPQAILSACFLKAVVQGQLSPLLVAAVSLPLLGGVWPAKPAIAFAVAAGHLSRRALIWAGLMLILSLLLRPTWIGEWIAAVQEYNIAVAPIQQPGGFLLLAALWRWRRPEARVLAALACAPHTIAFYDELPLFLIPRTKWEGYGLAMLSLVAAFVGGWLYPRYIGTPLEVNLAARWPIMFACLYVPALVMVLRPNPVREVAAIGPPGNASR
jgi:hypothetical protein